MQDLGAGIANGVNNKGQVVGNAFLLQSFAGFHAILWTQTGAMQDLNNLIPANSGWLLSEATAVNDAGQITVKALKDSFTQIHALLLSPRMATVLVSSRNPSFVGQAVNFEATVKNRIQGPPPNGDKVTFKSGNTVLATVALTKGSAEPSMRRVRRAR
jgi:uncharacterized membrane protein